ncbi:MAG TPA: hypothetical protein VK859_04420, partial [bacterium]|nr:hypothetical protein [bacterium]
TETPTLTVTGTSTGTPTITGTPTSSPTATATTCSSHGLTSQIGLGGFSTDDYYSDQVGLGQSTYVSSFSVYCQDNSSTGESAYIALYNASSGVLETSATFSVKLSDGSSYKTVAITPVTLPAGTYNLVILVPSGTNTLNVGASPNSVNFEYGTYAGGAPPANYSTLSATNLTGGFESVSGQTFYFTGCP